MVQPTLRQVLTGVLNDVKPVQDKSTTVEGVSTPLVAIEPLPKSTQTALLALHQIFPQLLLASLDLLDNGLVTQYIVSTQDAFTPHSRHPIYYVRSSQIRPTRYGAPTTRAVYEVRPAAWHCTCPSFAFSAFSARNVFDPFDCGSEDSIGSERWGGEMRGGQLAICKHLLAVVIGNRLNVIPKKEVDKDTLATYAFGAA